MNNYKSEEELKRYESIHYQGVAEIRPELWWCMGTAAAVIGAVILIIIFHNKGM